MPRYIDADAMLAEAKRLSGPHTGDGWDNWGVYALIERQPTVDVVEVRHGRWIPAKDYSDGNEDIECSNCGEWFKSLELCGRLGEPNYCPVCGAKMDGGQDE